MINQRLNDIYPIDEVLMIQYAMSGREARKLPKIKIAGVEFYLDLRLNEFREADNFMNRLDLNSLIDVGEGYLVCFDPNTKNIFSGSIDEFDLRKDADLVWVKLPMLKEMDPDGFKWLMQEFREGSPITVRPHQSKAYYENEKTQLESAIAKVELLYKRENHLPLLGKKRLTKSNRKKL